MIEVVVEDRSANEIIKKRINNNIVKEDPAYYSSRKGHSGRKNTKQWNNNTIHKDNNLFPYNSKPSTFRGRNVITDVITKASRSKKKNW